MNGVSAMILALSAPFAGAILVALSHRKPNQRETMTIVSAVVLFLAVLSIVPDVLAGSFPRLELFGVLPGLSVAFAVEPLGMLFALVASFLWIVNSLYSIGYMRGNDERNQTRFYVCFAVALGSTMGVAFAANMFTLFVFYELLTLSTYPLVTHKGTQEATAAGRTYIGLLLGTSIVFLISAMVGTLFVAGDLEFTPGGLLAGKIDGPEVAILLALYVFGIGKAAVMPVHRWLPAAMVAPTPVSALLHAVAVVKAGVFTVVKVVVYIFGVDTLAGSGNAGWLVWVAGFTVLAASIVALRQDNLKRRLAYSTISQLSYVVLAAAILTPISIVGAALHIAAHAFGKITLFFAAGSIYTAAHLTEVSELDGIGRRMPWTMGAFAVGALTMIGLPPTGGFLGKWFMLSGAMADGQWLPVSIIVASTLLNAAYFMPIVYAAFWRAPPKGASAHPPHGEAPWPIVAALVTTAVASFALFFFPGVPLALAWLLAGG
ncbi:MAG TPA: monovalent cation/H+ antiporter subunit D family protein [Alphaproteobacteria bacterium]|nr:monovalent cation/H+ antiporter subunit D family protein [Alphaproteobacteria bacterium]